MPIITRIDTDIRTHVATWRGAGERSVLVPTMGALHDGHLSLVDFAQDRAHRVIVSIFVNPTQFAEGEDFEDYPRTWERDIEMLRDKGVDAVYAPLSSVMYPERFATSVLVEGPALELETTYRPHFFRGVATVVAKLILGVQPDIAVFGEKDYQQLLVIKRMVSDLQIPCRIDGAPTIRETDGLAMSSRNRYLSESERETASKLNQTLQTCATDIRGGKPRGSSLQEAAEYLSQSGFKVDYLELRNADTLKRVDDIKNEPLRLLVAAHLGTTRLIDNIAV
ncbi:MAG: pantoate--beta-alanine ligase [Pseudomonadota bacterium]